MVTRLADQKGVDLVLPVTPFLGGSARTLIVLGDGDQGLADALHCRGRRASAQVAFVRGYDEALAHQLFAGADVFVMPSRFEPCGLAQMQAMRYGTLPVVTDVGGLHDTVVDVDDAPTHGTGVVVPAGELGCVDGRCCTGWSRPTRNRVAGRRCSGAAWPSTGRGDDPPRRTSSGIDG